VGRQAAQVKAQQPKTDELIVMVRTRRKQSGLSHREAAAAIGIPHTTLQSIEEGSMPTLPNFFALCHWLGVDADTFAPEQPHQAQEGPPARREIGYDPYMNGWTSI